MLGLKKREEAVVALATVEAETTEQTLARLRSELKVLTVEHHANMDELDQAIHIVGDKQQQISFNESVPLWERHRLSERIPILQEKFFATRMRREQLAHEITRLEAQRARALQPVMLAELRAAWKPLAASLRQMKRDAAAVRACVEKWQNAGVMGRAPFNIILPDWTNPESIDIALNCAIRDQYLDEE